MKTLAAVVFFALSLYLLPNPTHSTFNPIRLRTADKAAEADTAVLDINGDEVRAGEEYHIISAITGAGGGGVRLVRLDLNSKCASDVIVSPTDLDIGNPITITPVDSAATAVMPSTLVSFRFNVATNKLCVNNVNWRVQYDSTSGKYLLKAGEFNAVDDNQFKIEVVNADLNIYKITYCQFGGNVCYNVGRYSDPLFGITRLALTENNAPFIFVIVKASDV